MSSGLYSGVSGLALGVGLYRNVTGFWSGASGLVTGWGGTGGGPLVLDLDFLSGVLDPRITFSRASAATYFNSAGQITLAAANEARFDHFPDTLLPRGLLLEDARTNLLLNSLINGTNLSTQSVTVTAQPYTLSFYGTGQIVLSGAASATVVGSGAFPNRRVILFTPSAGSLTLTVTGTVQYAQLEAGNSASSFIPTAGTATTRAADSAAMIGSGFSSWYTPTAGSIILGAETAFTTVANKPSALLFQSTGSDFQALSVSGGSRSITYDVGASDFLLDFIAQSYSSMALPLLQASLVSDFADPYYVYGQAAAYQLDDFANSGNGEGPSTDGTGSVPVGVNALVFGPNDNTLGYGGWFGWLRTVTIYGSRLPDATLASLSAIAGASPASLRLRFLTGQYYSGDTPFQTPLSLSLDFLSGLYVVDDLL